MRTIEAPDNLRAELGGTGQPVRWEELSSPQAAEMTARTNTILLTFGAVEQHGPHMALCVDWTLSWYIAQSVSALTGVPVLQPLPFGVSGSHGGFPGTVGLRPETFLAAVEDMTDWLYRSGIRQYILLNGHAWNGAPLQVSAEKLRTRYDDVRVRALDYVDMYPPEEIDGRVTYGRLLAHANYFETSCMLHVAHDLVHLDAAVAHEDHDSFWDYRADQVSASGVWGRDVPQASPENGKAEIRRCVETMARAVAAARDEPWPAPD